MAPTLQGELADFAVAEYDAQPQFFENLIAKGEGAAKTAIVGIVSNIKVAGPGAFIVSAIDGAAERFADQLLAKYPPPVLYAMIGAWLKTESKALGG